MPASVNKITFIGSQGDELAGRLDLPPREPAAIALFAHCFTCGKDIAAASRISAGLVAEGFGVLRFDFTGLGSSEGEFANTNFTSNVDDLIAAADMLRDRHRAPSLLVGHSLGGAAVLAAASRIPEVTAVATIAAPADPAHVTGVFTHDALDAINQHGEAQVDLAGRPFRITRQFLDDIGGQRLDDAVSALGAALLVMHSPVDTLVDVDHARRIYMSARHPKSFISLDGSDHLLTSRSDSAYVARVLAAWASRYVPPAPFDAASSASERREGEVVVEDAGAGDFAQTVYAGRHVLTADEPLGIGDDTGPTPYDLLLAGLGTCTSMTLHMYARRKGLPLNHVKVTLSHERTHSDDCTDPDVTPCRVERISRHIELTGDLDDQQQGRLLDIADKCPVHRTLAGDLRVSTTMTPVAAT
ncbi:MAG: alpha/beta fold hydrolase [Acidimicrobiia bacterium]